MEAFHYGDVNLHFKRIGNSQAERKLIFLHGFLEDHSMWEQITPAYQKNFECILIDLPCHGLSRFVGEICPMSLMAEAVAALLTELSLENCTIIGHSMGGYVGLEILKLQKHHLILLHSNFWADPPEKKKDRDRVIKIVQNNKAKFIREAIPGLFAPVNKERCAEHIDQLIQEAIKIPANEIIAATAGMRDRQENYELMRHEHISIIQGQLDPIINSDTLIQELSIIKSPVPIKSIPNSGHMSCFERPRALIEALNHLLIG